MQALEQADIVLLLLTASYSNSDHCWNVEARRAIERSEAGRASILPILVGDIEWQSTPLKKYSIVPKDLKPVMESRSLPEVWTEVAQAIRKLVSHVRERKALPFKTVIASSS